MKTLIFLVILAILMLASNPSLEKHKAAVKEKYIELVDSKVDDTELGEGLKTLSKGLGGLIVDGLLDSRISRANYLLFSLTQFQRDGKQEIVGIGVFGNVFIFTSQKFDKKDISEDFGS